QAQVAHLWHSAEAARLQRVAAPAAPPPPPSWAPIQPEQPAPAAAPPETAAPPSAPPEDAESADARPQPPDAVVSPGPATASVPPVPPTPASEPEPGFEERFGTQWVVWVGGLALALGAIFLVRYAIEQDLVGPGVRIFLGTLLAATLVGAGEWTRRNEVRSGLGEIQAAYIPGILTAAGTTAAYATAYSAYALYDFLSPGSAFVLLGMVALATLAAALLHGPGLAGLGLVGAYVTPLLVSTGKPNFWALYLYLAAVTAAAFMLARARMWRWLAITAIAFGFLWTLPGLGLLPVIGVAAHSFHVTIGFALVAVFIVCGLLLG